MINKASEYLILIVMLYMAVDLSSMVFAYKIIEIGPVIGAASSLIFPLTYSIMDIIAEVYGYQTARKIVWFAFFCDFIFALLVYFISQIPSQKNFETQAYLLVLGNLLRAVFAQTVGVLAGSFMNIYLISRWKVMTKGRYFWLRSIGSSTIGEAIMLVISVVIALAGILSPAKIMKLIFYAYMYKIIFAIVLAPFISLVAAILKTQTGINNDDFSRFTLPNMQDKTDPAPTYQ